MRKKQIDRYINEALSKYHLPKENLLFAGMSLAGTRALKYTIFSKQGKTAAGIVPKAIAILAYTEPDVKWWMSTRRKDYYSMNAVDFAAFIDALNLMGNQQAELILTTDQGYLPDGSRHPHSWSIVDNKELIEWFISLPAK